MFPTDPLPQWGLEPDQAIEPIISNRDVLDKITASEAARPKLGQSSLHCQAIHWPDRPADPYRKSDKF